MALLVFQLTFIVNPQAVATACRDACHCVVRVAAISIRGVHVTEIHCTLYIGASTGKRRRTQARPGRNFETPKYQAPGSRSVMRYIDRFISDRHWSISLG